MAVKKSLPDLTRTEFDILRVLWKSGRLNVREVHEQMTKIYDWAYTTTKTMMDRMVGKELLKRESFHGVFLYTPLISRPIGFARLIRFISDRVLELDYSAVMSLFARSDALTPEEIKELSQLLNQEKAKEK
jgi:BlaI family transcriptional regulator, penicillinase repressor